MADVKRSYVGMMLVTVFCLAASFFLLRGYVFEPMLETPIVVDGEENTDTSDALEGAGESDKGLSSGKLGAKSGAAQELLSLSPASSIGTQDNLTTLTDKDREEKYGFRPIAFKDDTVSFTSVQKKNFNAVFTNRGGVLAVYRFVDENGKVVFYRTPDSPMVKPAEAEMPEGGAQGLLLLGPPRTLSKDMLQGDEGELESARVGQNPFPETIDRATDPSTFDRAWEFFPEADAWAFGFRGKESWRNGVEWVLEDVSEEDDHTRVVYSLPTDKQGVSVRKTFEVYDAYKIICNITFTNDGEEKYSPGVNIYGPVGIRHDVREHQYAGAIALYQEGRSVFEDEHMRFQEFNDAYEDYEEELGTSSEVRALPAHVLYDIDEPGRRQLVMTGLSDGYFIAAIGIDQWRDSKAVPGGEVISPTAATSEQTMTVTYNFPKTEILGTKDAPDASREASWRVVMYAGPRDRDLLEQAFYTGNPVGVASKGQRDEIEWQNLVYQGWPAPISWLIRTILEWLNSETGNVAVSILLLTLIVRFSLAFLSIRAQFSMQTHAHKMKKIKPKLDEVKAKYKDQKNREAQMLQYQEIRAVMKNAGVGFLPLGGCLPILLQMPIFIALFNSLRTSFMLRHESFLWMNDLARPDALPLFEIQSTIPLLSSHGYITLNLLPLIWGGLIIYQQFRQPKATDPQQAQAQKMTRIVFFIFPFMWYAMPAGFMLYFVVSSIYTQIESRLVKLYLIKKGVIDKDEKGVAVGMAM